VVVACLVGLALTAPIRAADDKTPDQKALDHYVYTSLRFVINHGVDAYNAGRPEECYEHFRQSLQDLVPILAGHPDLQTLVKDGLEKTEKDPEWRVKMAAKATMPNPQLADPVRQKSFALRAIFNEVRAGVHGEKRKPEEKPKPTTLWDRLGGEKGVAQVVEDFAALVSNDPKVDLTRGGKFKLDDLAVANLKKQTVAFVSSVTGGPLKYTGKSMKEVHKGMGITNEEFDAAVADLQKALNKNNVKAADADALLKIVETTRKDIVEGKKTEPPKEDLGTIKGKVTVDGKPLAKGTVTLVDKSGKKYSAAIAADGTIALEKVPLGAYKVAVADGKDIPAKYADPETSSITTNVTKGANQLDLDLKGAKKPEEKAKPGEKPKPAAIEAPKVPEAIAVPKGNLVLAKLQADGVQNYEAKAKTGGGFEWAPKGPEAELKDNGKTLGKHYASKDGPVWEIEGDKVTGELPPKKAEVKEGDLPWLLVKVKDFKPHDGKAPPFTLTYVQRIDTEGGVAPTKAPEKAGEAVKVKYKATYVLYAAEPKKPEK
jgi:hemoglobin